MNVYETMMGVVQAVRDAQGEARKTDRIFQEVNGKIMLSPRTPLALRDEWQAAYRAWSTWAGDSSLLREAEPRMTSDAVRASVRACVELKVRGLQIYQRWKTSAGSSPSSARVGLVGAPTTAGALSQKENGALRGALVVAALLGGAAAGKMLYDSFAKKKTPPAAPPPSPLQAMFPAGMPGVPMLPGIPAVSQVGYGSSVSVPLASITPHLYPPQLYPPGYVPPLASYPHCGDESDE